MLASLLASLYATPHVDAAFRTGLAVTPQEVASTADRAGWFPKATEAKARIVRIFLSWREVGTSAPLNPGDPEDLAYNFSSYDSLISDVVSQGFAPVVTITAAPSYAEGPDRPASAAPGTWKPDPAAYGAFARAVATRYSGNFDGLPRVRYFEAWNEPNLPQYLSPQYDGDHLVSVDRYRSMLNAFYAGVKAANESNVVIAGAQAPFGDDSAGGFGRARPLRFMRELLCLKPNLRKTHCPERPAFDVWSHHPIDYPGGPEHSAVDPDDVTTPDMDRMGRVLRAAERRHTIAGGRKHHQMWATELWWETNPPDPAATASPATQARWIPESLYELWKDGVKVVINLPLIDGPRILQNGFDLTLQSGLFYVNGEPKPGFEAFRFPFVTERRSPDKLFVWGKAPAGGKLKIQRKAGGGWRTVAAVDAHTGKVFTTKIKLRGPATLRATVGGEHSVAFRQRH